VIWPKDDQIDITELAVALRRSCTRNGLALSVSAAIDLQEAFQQLPRPDPAGLYYASRAICVHRLEERVLFDLAFFSLFDQVSTDDQVIADELVERFEGPGPYGSEDTTDGQPMFKVGAYSRNEYLQDRDITTCSVDELEMISAALARLDRRHARPSRRRTRSTPRSSEAIDLRRSIGVSRSIAGEIFELRYRARRAKSRRVVFLVDVSGSMETYVPVFLRLIHGISRGAIRVEAFSLGTRLTRLSRAISRTTVGEALREIRGLVQDWSGGTRLGESLERFNDLFGIRGLARGATIVIVSDGLDRGDPEMLARQMRRLHLVARQVIWINPLKASHHYEPLARGMRAAMPNIDHFISGHSLSSLIELVGLIHRPVRFHPFRGAPVIGPGH